MATKKKSQTYENLHDLLLLKLEVLHDVESQLIKALPKMAEAATAPELRDAFTMHLEETRRQEERIDRALELMGKPEKPKEKSAAIRGLIEDAQWCIKAVKNPEARDAILIAAAQYVEHYEMAGYGSALSWAEEMGHSQIAELLQETLDEEEAADTKLSDLAEGGINEAANDMQEEESE